MPKRETQIQRSLKMFRAGKTFDDVVASTSNSTAKRALEIYRPELNQKIEREKKNLRDLRARIKEAQNRHEKMEQIIVDETRQMDDMTKTISEYKETIDELEYKAQSLRGEISSVEQRLEELDEKGITPERLTSITEMNLTSWQDLFERVSTSQKYEALDVQNQTITQEVEALQSTKTQLEDSLAQLGESIKSEENKLDETKREHSLFQDSINILNEFQKKGYTSDILKQLLNAVDNVAIKGEPIASIKRFLERIDQAKEVEGLESQIINRRKQLESLKNNLSEIKGTYRSIHTETLKPIKAIHKKAINSIDSVSQAATKQIKSEGDYLEEILKKVQTETLTALGDQQAIGQTLLNEQISRLKNELYEARVQFALSMKNLEVDMKKWGQIKTETGKLEADIKLANLFFKVTRSPRDMTSVPLEIVVYLMDGIHEYIVQKYPSVDIKAPTTVTAKEYSITIFDTYKFTSISEWLLHVLKQSYFGGI